MQSEYNLSITEEDGMLWAEVVELPGTFVSGEDMDELLEAAAEAIVMVVQPEPTKRRFRPSPPMPKARPQSAKLCLA